MEDTKRSRSASLKWFSGDSFHIFANRLALNVPACYGKPPLVTLEVPTKDPRGPKGAVVALEPRIRVSKSRIRFQNVIS